MRIGKNFKLENPRLAAKRYNSRIVGAFTLGRKENYL